MAIYTNRDQSRPRIKKAKLTFPERIPLVKLVVPSDLLPCFIVGGGLSIWLELILAVLGYKIGTLSNDDGDAKDNVQ